MSAELTDAVLQDLLGKDELVRSSMPPSVRDQLPPIPDLVAEIRRLRAAPPGHELIGDGLLRDLDANAEVRLRRGHDELARVARLAVAEIRRLRGERGEPNGGGRGGSGEPENEVLVEGPARSSAEEPIEEIRDQLGRDLGIVYAVKLGYVVTGCCPCSKADLIELVQSRMDAAGGIEEADVCEVEILSVETL